MPWYRFITIVTGLVLALGIRLLLYRTRLGVAMRAVVDNRDLAALNGARPGRTSQFAWALGTSMAAIAGIFLAEELSNLSVETLTLFIVDAFAAAIIGRLRSLPLTYVGGMIIGLSIAFQQNFLTLVGALELGVVRDPDDDPVPRAALPAAGAHRGPPDHEQGDPPRVPTLQASARRHGSCCSAFMLVERVIWDRIGIRNLTLVMLDAFIMLSLVPLTGWSGQISLAQVTFVGIGAWSLVEFASGGGQVFGLEIFNGEPVGCCSSRRRRGADRGADGAPALRLQGLYLALATMAFARMAEFVIFDQPEVFGGAGTRLAPTRAVRVRTSTSRSRSSGSTSRRTPASALRHRACSASSASAWSRCGAARSAAGWWRCATARPRARPSA